MGGKNCRNDGKLKHDYDTDRKMTTLTNVFAQDYEKKKPKSQGLCFQDVYLNDDWFPAPMIP